MISITPKHFFSFFYFRFCFFLMGKEPRSEIKALAVARPFSTCKVFINTVLFQMAALGPRSAYSPGRMHGEIKTGDLTQFFCFVALSTTLTCFAG